MTYLNKKILALLLFCIILTSGIFLQGALGIGNIGKLSDSSFYDSNTLFVVGEVKNTGDVAIQNTNVRVVFYDDLNQKINAVEGYTDLNVIGPGRKSFFNIRILESEGSLNVKNYTIWFNWTDTAVGKPEGLVILSRNESIDSDGHKHISGQIQNQGTLNSNNTEVSATFYNSTGTVIGTAWSFSTPTHLAPNQIADFDIELIYTQQVAKIAIFSLTAESNSLAFSPTPLISPSLSSSPTTSTSTSPSPTTTLSISPNPTTTTSTSTSSSPTATASPNPTPNPQNTQQPSLSPSTSTTTSPTTTPQPTTTPADSHLPSPTITPSTESPSALLATIVAIIIIVLVVAFIYYWIKKGKREGEKLI